MDLKTSKLISRIDHLLAVGGEIGIGVSGESAGEAFQGTLELMTSLYGPDSQQVKALLEIRSRDVGSVHPHTKNAYVLRELRGVLRGIRSSVEAGLYVSLRDQARGEVLADFVALGKQSLDGGSKDVAAVLACAALEDTLKRYADSNGLNVEDKDLSEVINALKAAALLSGATPRIVQSFVAVRNRAFHAEWAKIDAAEVQSVLAFIQTFLLERFG